MARQPVIDVIDEGWACRLRVEVDETQRIELRGRLRESHVDGVRLAELPPTQYMGPQEGITVQVPDVRTRITEVQAVLQAEETLCVVSPQPYRQEDRNASPMARVFRFRPSRIPESETLKAFAP